MNHTLEHNGEALLSLRARSTSYCWPVTNPCKVLHRERLLNASARQRRETRISARLMSRFAAYVIKIRRKTVGHTAWRRLLFSLGGVLLIQIDGRNPEASMNGERARRQRCYASK